MKSKWLIIIAFLAIGSTLTSCAPKEECLLGGDAFTNLASFKEYRRQFPEQQEEIVLTAVGDIMLSRYVAHNINQAEDPDQVFAAVNQFLQKGDLVFGNLENPLTPGRKIEIPEMIFRADPVMASVLKKSGFNILSLANNHIADFGAEGLLDTLGCLDDLSIEYCGVGKTAEEALAPCYMEAKGVKLAFLAFTDAAIMPDSFNEGREAKIAFSDPQAVVTAVGEAAVNADLTIVYLHGGEEYVGEADEPQVKLAHLAIDSGADLVLGSHPHMAQKVEQYRGKYIFYSLGNFVFDQLWSQETRESIIAKFYFSKHRLEKVEILPVFINDKCFPEALGGEAGRKVAERLDLELETVLLPAWDTEEEKFITIEQYVFFPEPVIDNIRAGQSFFRSFFKMILPGQENDFTAREDSPYFRLIKNRQFDLDGDGYPEEIKLRDGQVEIWRAKQLIWQSSEKWWVDDFFLGDANNDGRVEIGLLLWKEGSFGPYQPFWLQERDNSFRNHLFLFKLEAGAIKALWHSSNLDRPNYQATLVDLNNDGENELLVIEGSYSDPKLRKITLWQWNGWGFSRL
ncbi:MAG: CapA family protein [Bacillota bacterium]